MDNQEDLGQAAVRVAARGDVAAHAPHGEVVDKARALKGEFFVVRHGNFPPVSGSLGDAVCKTHPQVFLSRVYGCIDGLQLQL
jgi:hypothetical protein